MLESTDLEKVLFLDIETVPQFRTYDDVPEALQALWGKKARTITRSDETPEELYDRAGIYAEFGKIVCISVGIVRGSGSQRKVRLKSFFGHDEKELLTGFIGLLNSHYHSPQHLLCGHNGKEFDFPYIARRALINGLKLPALLNIAGKKPWEINHLDTMELWKFGDFKNYTSLSLLAAVFDIPTPKDDIDGSDVGRVYWEEDDLQRIATYCQKDVLALVQLMLRYRGEALIPDDLVETV